MSLYYLRQDSYFGKENTSKLQNSSVLIVGLGGLGSGLAQILARMGVGKIILVDKDTISEHNLSRQQLYTAKDIGISKVVACKKHLEEINPKISVIIYEEMADKDFFNKINSIDCIIDCTDRHSSRRDINEFCLNKQIPWVHAGAIREQGVLCVFGPKYELKSYEDIYSGKNEDEFCEGVIATTTNVISSLQASLVVKVLLDKEVPKTLLRINLDSWSFEEFKVSKK